MLGGDGRQGMRVMKRSAPLLFLLLALAAPAAVSLPPAVEAAVTTAVRARVGADAATQEGTCAACGPDQAGKALAGLVTRLVQDATTRPRGQVEVLASPHLMMLDNKEAEMVPIGVDENKCGSSTALQR